MPIMGIQQMMAQNRQRMAQNPYQPSVPMQQMQSMPSAQNLIGSAAQIPLPTGQGRPPYLIDRNPQTMNQTPSFEARLALLARKLSPMISR